MNRHWRPGALILMLASAALATDTSLSTRDCLFATHADGKELKPCADNDPLMLHASTKLELAKQALKIPAGRVSFRGCTGQRFATYIESATKSGEYKYVVTYPSETPDDYLAPMIHELAHVMQLEDAGGSKSAVRNARGNKSLRIELEADYLTGIVFSQILKTDSVVAFQHNKTFAGMFKEDEYDAHGTPSQRTSAFRMGYYQTLDEDLPDIKTAALHFQANVYDDLARSR